MIGHRIRAPFSFTASPAAPPLVRCEPASLSILGRAAPRASRPFVPSSHQRCSVNVHEYVRTQSSRGGLACQPLDVPARTRNAETLGLGSTALTRLADSHARLDDIDAPGETRKDAPADTTRLLCVRGAPAWRSHDIDADRSPSTTEPSGKHLPNGSIPSHPIDCRKTSWVQPESASEPPIVPLDDDHAARPDHYCHGSARVTSSVSVRHCATVAGAFPGRRRSPPARPLPAR